MSRASELIREMVGLRAGIICRKWRTTVSPHYHFWVGVCDVGCPQVGLLPGGECLFEDDQERCPCVEPEEGAVISS